MASCRGCGKPIVWAVSQMGKKLPLERIKTPIYRIGGDVFDPKGLATKLDPVMTGPLYISHFATCPQASQFSKPKKPKGE